MTEGQLARLPERAGGLPPDVLELIQLRMPRWQRFAEAYCVTGNAHRAALEAGYSARHARVKGQKLLRQAEVAAAIAAVRAALAERAKFGQDKAMAQLAADREFAILTENATAAVRATELMAKMSGHLIDRIDARIQQVPFTIELRGFEPPPIDGEAREVTR